MPLEQEFGKDWTTFFYDSREHFDLGIGYCAACGYEPDEDCKRLSFCPNFGCLKEIKNHEVPDLSD
jgi:hypothetical protein